MADYYKCWKCGKILVPGQCPNGLVPIKHDMDGGVYWPEWFLRLKPRPELAVSVSDVT